MSNSYRIRTQVGVDKSIKVLLDQDFEYLEILSLKVLQSQIYTRKCSDYGVIIGRVTTNGGFGIPNAKVSVFIPLTSEDETNPIISELYPYKTLSQLNEDGYRYNLLPYKNSYSEHSATGTFFTREDVLIDPTLIQVFDKYFKYTARTNDSGDYMIFGVPVGEQTIHVDIDLSDIGDFSLSPQDLIRMGVATEAQVAGTKFKTSTNLAELPQIISINRVLEVEPLWGQPEICNLGITRTDFDLSDEANITITPTSIFMGSIFSDTDRMALKTNCKPRIRQGELCNLTTGPGEILAIRQTIEQDIFGRPVLETVELDSGGQVIDENGTWLLDVPMNLDYVITNEFGEQVLSNDPKKGIPTKGKYRFKVKWNQEPNISENVKRGYFLIPNIKEYGWDSTGGSIISGILRRKSYAFSLDWDDYSNIQSAINCDDTFYYMSFNKVYSVSQLIDQFRRGSLPNRFVSVKNILDDSCESDNNRFPTNDTVFRMDIIYLLFLFAMVVFRPILYVLIFVIHMVYVILTILKVLMPLLIYNVLLLMVNEFLSVALAYPSLGLMLPFGLKGILYLLFSIALAVLWVKLLKTKLKPINIPILLYDQCEFCDCKDPEDLVDESYDNEVSSETSASSGGQVIQPNTTGLQIAQFSTSSYNLDQLTSNPPISAINNLMTGQKFYNPPTSTPICSSLVPGLESNTESNGDNYLYMTTSLTLAERINLFNAKAKYFNDGVNNPGGGVNRVKVSFEQGSGLYHQDNIVFMMLTPGSVLAAGDIITFQDPKMSKDINLTGATENIYNNNAITGGSVNTSFYSKTIFYANPTGATGTLLSTTYTLQPPNSADTNYHKFPVDLEYFQVVTAMTYSTFNTLSTGASPSNSLNNRFLNNNMSFLKIDNSGGVNQNLASIIFDNPLQSFNDYNTHICVFLVRGVDPYSSRQTVEYDLSLIFGFPAYGQLSCTVQGQYKLNQPIYGGVSNHFKNVNHATLFGNSNDGVDTAYSNSQLYFETFNYQPSTQFSGFSSNLPSYYSKLDNNLTSMSWTCYCPTFNGWTNINVNGISVNNPNINNLPPGFTITNNSFAAEYSNTPIVAGTYQSSLNSLSTGLNRGYYPGEIVEGVTLMMMQSTIYTTIVSTPPSISTAYLSVTYPTTLSIDYPSGLQSSMKLVMRSDRLPASTQNVSNCGNNYILQNNSNLAIFKISDEGVLGLQAQEPNPTMSQGPPDGDQPTSAVSNAVIDSLNNCSNSVPLECYSYDASQNEFTVSPGTCETKNGVSIWSKGCYKLVTKILISIPADLRILTEWLARTNITFGACRNVFSHTFKNNWINGTLYAFAFKNNRQYNSLNLPSGNDFCTSVMYLDTDTNNFYYRSSPYHSGATQEYFCGDKTNPTGGIQEGNLKYPTTLVDLGPRSNYLQEIVMSDDYDGYVMSKLKTTTFGDISDLLNIFIISRLASTSFIQLIFSTQGANIFSYFNKRGKLQVDADYAQMISINSELGVAEFESSNYPSIPFFQDPIYFNGGNNADGVFGIFFSSDTQTRDFIAPKRTIIVPTGTTTNICTYSSFNVFTQNVPFYQWEIKPNNDTDSIFGSQGNTWFTQPLSSNEYFNNFYQKMDRIQPSSRYFRTALGMSTNQSYLKGYIWGINSGGHYDASLTGTPPFVGGQDLNSIQGRTISVGSPFHFYFGLKKGKSAWDRFATKWIGFETITD